MAHQQSKDEFGAGMYVLNEQFYKKLSKWFISKRFIFNEEVNKLILISVQNKKINLLIIIATLKVEMAIYYPFYETKSIRNNEITVYHSII